VVYVIRRPSKEARRNEHACAIGWKPWAASRVPAQRNTSECGVVYVEFLIAFIPLFVLVLGICQLSFIAAAKVIVEHSAWRAARAAVVVLEDDPEKNGGSPRGFYLLGSSRAVPEIADVIEQMHIADGEGDQELIRGGGIKSAGRSLGWGALGSAITKAVGAVSVATSNKFSRMSRIRAAAYVPLLPLANTDRNTGSESINSAIHSQFFDRIAEAVVYTRAAASVTLHTSINDEQVAAQPIDRNAPITARVVYLYSCDVPVIRLMVCSTLASLSQQSKDPAVQALKHAENASDLPSVASATGRYTILVGKATLLNQGAGYEHEASE